MLNLYIETDQTYLRVPHIDENLYVDIRGRLFTQALVGYTQLDTISGEFTIHIEGVPYTVPVVNIIQVTWKPVYSGDFLYYLTERDVWFTDNNQSNLHPINLIWGYEKSMIGDFYRIPGFSWYLLTNDNRVFSRVSNEYLTVTLMEDRHASAYISPDCKQGKGNTITVHRLVAFSKIPYEINVCKLEVNHIDGNKWNYVESNLEWVTRRQNNVHAQSTGLKKDSNTIKVTNLETNVVEEFYSQATCSKALGVDPRNFSMYLRKFDGCWIYKGKYKVEIIKVGLVKPKHNTSARITLVKDLVSGEIHEFGSLAKAAPLLGITVAALKKRHGRGTTVFGNLHLKTYNPLLGETRPSFED